MPVPSSRELRRAASAIPEVADEVSRRRFTPEEAKQVGFVAEAAVDWSDEVDAELASTSTWATELQPAEPMSASIAAVLDPEADSQLGPSTSESGEAGEPIKGRS